MEELDIDQLKQENSDKKRQQLRMLKNELIGCKDKKELYFNKGIIETLMPMLAKEVDDKLLLEIITIINCYFFDFPKVFECFALYKHTFVQLHFFLETYKEKSALIDMVLRIIKNALCNGIVKPTDFEDQHMIESLKPLMTTRYRIQIIAKIIAQLCEDMYFRDQVTANKELVLSILTQVTKNSLQISDECIENCLAALAAASHNNEEVCKLIYAQEDAVKQIAQFMRHPERNIKIQMAKILTHVNKVQKLPREYEQTFRWILMHMIQLMPVISHEHKVIGDICQIIQSIASDPPHAKSMQKLAGDIEAIEKICDILLAQKSQDNDDVEMVSADQCQPSQILLKCLFYALAGLTSMEESCRKRLVEKKKVLEELLAGIKSTSRDVKLAACTCFVSLSRSDKMLKSIILEAGDFQKELCNIILHSDNDQELELVACKAITNLAIDIQKAFSKEEELLRKLVSLTSSTNPDLKLTSTFALKNFLFKCTKDVKACVMREFTYEKLLHLLDDENTKVQEQALMIYRNLLSTGEDDIQNVLTETGPDLLNKFVSNLKAKENQIVVQTIYVLACIASGSQKHKKQMIEERFFGQALEMLKSTEEKSIKIGVLNFLINLAWKDKDKDPYSKTRQQMIDMNLKEVLVKLHESERESDVKTYFDRIIKKLN